jgi:hypothetical protein
MSKADQIAALRISKAEKREADSKAVKIAKAKAIVDNGPALLTSVNKKATNAKHQAKWREANIETQRERSRSSMRKLREKKANG